MNPTPEDAAEQRRKKNRAYYQANKERLREYSKAYQKERRLRLNALKRASYDEERKAAKRAYYLANRDRILRAKQDYYLRKIDSIQAYRAENKDRISAQNSRWHRENRDRIRQRKRDEGRRRREQPSKRMASTLRRRLNKLVKSEGRSQGCGELLGCSFQQFADHIAGMFAHGMSWENYGRRWHIDHVIPCSAFDLTREAHVRQCFHFTNLRPLWARDNLRKGAKLTDPQLRLLL